MPETGKLVLKKSEPLPTNEDPLRHVWKVLVVDDEPTVLDITRQVLRNVEFMGRRLELFFASSGAEARKILASEDDVAVILLDVVMEDDHTGLELVEHIRNELKNEYVRIILRTGQPGSAPERRVILDYDINDYREKTELTATRLTTSLISSIRNYDLITRLDRCLEGMETVVSSIWGLMKMRSYQRFAQGLLTQLLALLNLHESGLYAHVSACAAEESEEAFTILAGVGEFSDPAYRDGSRSLPRRIVKMICRAIDEGHHLAVGGEFVGYIPSESGGPNRILYLRDISGMEPMHRRVIETFLTNISIGFDTVAELEQLRGQVENN
jgi:CheY-like chemotaxis protein